MASWQGFDAKVVDVFGGLVTNVDRNDLGGVFVSPNCQDVEFTVGSVHSRRGCTIFKDLAIAGLPTSAPCTSLFPAWQPTLGPVTVAYFAGTAGADDGGYMVAIDINGTWGTNQLGPINTYGMIGVSALSRFWMAFPTAATGGSYGTSTTVPRVFDYNASSKFYRVGLPRPVWQDATIAEVASTGNTLTAGTHYFRVTFESQDGNMSPISGALSVVATGGPNTGIQITNVPTGPPGTIRRVIWANTAADVAANGVVSQNFFTLRTSSMVINDNTTTTVVVAFTDSVLTAGETASGNALFTLMQPPPAKGVVFYKNRAFWYHLLGGVQQSYQSHTSTFNNIEWNSDCSAFVGAGTVAGLRGWTATGQFSVVAGDAGIRLLRITADGSATYAANSPVMSQVGDPRVLMTFQQGKQYGIQFRARRGAAAFTQGSLNFNSNISGYAYSYTVTLSSLTTSWQTFYTGPLQSGFDYTTSAKNPAFQIQLTGTPTAASYVEIEPLQLYDATNAANGGRGNAWQGSLVLASKPYYPGTCDGATGLMSVNVDDGEHLQAAFVFRDNLYFVKNHSMYVTADNGVTEPGGWTIQNVSKVCGTFSPNGVAVGDAFVIICGADGVYMFDGGAPQKISQEIAPTWARIPQTRMYEVSVTINQQDKQVVISVPLDSETVASHQIVLDYVEGFGDPLESNGHGRKWTIWNVAPAGYGNASCALFTDWGFVNVPFLMYGNNGALFKQTTATTDNGTAINARYETSPIGYGGAGVSLIGGVILNANGTSMDVSYTNPFGTNTAIGTYALTNPMTRVTQALLNLSYETVGIRVAGTSYWSVNRMTVFARSHPYFNIRGYNP